MLDFIPLFFPCHEIGHPLPASSDNCGGFMFRKNSAMFHLLTAINTSRVNIMHIKL